MVILVRDSQLKREHLNFKDNIEVNNISELI